MSSTGRSDEQKRQMADEKLPQVKPLTPPSRPSAPMRKPAFMSLPLVDTDTPGIPPHLVSGQISHRGMSPRNGSQTDRPAFRSRMFSGGNNPKEIPTNLSFVAYPVMIHNGVNPQKENGRGAQNGKNEANDFSVEEEMAAMQMSHVDEERRLLALEKDAIAQELRSLQNALRSEPTGDNALGLNARLEAAQSRLSQLTARNESLTEALKSVGQRYGEAGKLWSQAQQQLRADLNASLENSSQLTAQRDALEARLRVLKQELEAAQSKLELEQPNRLLLAEARRQLNEETERNSALGRRVAALEQQSREAIQKAVDQTAALDEAQKKFSQDRERLTADLRRFATDLEAARRQVGAQEAAIAELAARADGARKETDMERELRISAQRSIEQLQAYITQMEGGKEDNVADMRKVKNEMDTTREQLLTLQVEINNLRLQHDEERAAFETDLAAKTAAVASLESRLLAAANEKKEVEAKLLVTDQGRIESTGKFEAEKTARERDQEEFQRRMQVVSAEIREMEVEKDKALAEFMKANAAKEGAEASMAKERQELGRVINELEAQISATKRERDAALELQARTKAEVDKLRQELKSQKDLVTQSQLDRENLAAQAASREKEMTVKHQGDVSTLQETNKSVVEALKKQLQQFSDARRKAEVEVARLTEANRQLNDFKSRANLDMAQERERLKSQFEREKVAIQKQLEGVVAEMQAKARDFEAKTAQWDVERAIALERARRLEDEINRVNKDIESAERGIVDRDSEIMALRQRMAQLDVELRDSKMTLENVKDALQDEITKLRARLAEARQERIDFENKAAAERESMRQAAMADQAEFVRNLNVKDQAISEAKGENDRLGRELIKLNGEMKRLSDQARSERTLFEKDMASLEGRLAKMSQDMAHAEARNQQAVEALNQQKQQLASELADSRGRVGVLERQLEKSYQDKTELQRQTTADREAAKEEMSRLRENMLLIATERDRLGQEAAGLKNVVNQLHEEGRKAEFQAQAAHDTLSKSLARLHQQKMMMGSVS